MKDDEPHRIQDDEAPGEQAMSSISVTASRKKAKRKKSRFKIIVSIGFDDNLKEFQLWDYLYDVKTEHFEMEAVPDYKNRIQYYELSSDIFSLRKFRTWLKENDFKFKFDRT